MRAAGAKFYRDRQTSMVPRHHPKPMLKSACEEFWQRKGNELWASVSPFRSSKSVSNYAFCEYMLLTGLSHDQELCTTQILGSEEVFNCDTLTLNDDKDSHWNTLNVEELRKRIHPDYDIRLKELFNHSLVITCNRRRKILLNATFHMVGLPRPMAFSAVTPSVFNGGVLNYPNGELLNAMQEEYGFNTTTLWNDIGRKAVKKCCTMSHLLATYYAKVNNWPFVLIFEDDAWPNNDIAEDCKFVMDEIHRMQESNEKLNFLRLGYNGPDTNKDFQTRIVNYEDFRGSHAYIVFNGFYDEYIKSSLKKFKPADHILEDGTCAFMTDKSIFIQFNSDLYNDSNYKNISVKTTGECVYIKNRIFSPKCPDGYLDFKEVQKFLNDFDNMGQQSLQARGIDGQTPFDVDVVVTYVDSSDPVWQKAFNETKERECAKGTLPIFKESLTPNRFRSNGELEICLFGIRKFMPWVRDIHLVVSNPEQVPEYAKNYNVKVVLHKDIVPEQFLP